MKEGFYQPVFEAKTNPFFKISVASMTLVFSLPFLSSFSCLSSTLHTSCLYPHEQRIPGSCYTKGGMVLNDTQANFTVQFHLSIKIGFDRHLLSWVKFHTEELKVLGLMCGCPSRTTDFQDIILTVYSGVFIPPQRLIYHHIIKEEWLQQTSEFEERH